MGGDTVSSAVVCTLITVELSFVNIYNYCNLLHMTCVFYIYCNSHFTFTVNFSPSGKKF